MSNTEQDAWVERVLNVSVAESDLPSGDTEDALGLKLDDYWTAARAMFERAQAAVDAQVSALQAALRDEDDDDELQEIADSGLIQMTNGTRVPLMAAMMEAGSGGPSLRKGAPGLIAAAQAFQAQLEADPRIVACDENPFGVAMSIGDTYTPALEAVIDVARAALRG